VHSKLVTLSSAATDPRDPLIKCVTVNTNWLTTKSTASSMPFGKQLIVSTNSVYIYIAVWYRNYTVNVISPYRYFICY